ncbi:hypothetical protein TorRG33x02_063700 [Trema orientale]|uniref:Uncharacterized protein n=1 Tax=Trema orientale TaxID=63057 RepID=A0A2P5FJ13_TREOI|nr:hypothetical protein TorRG33x02_063700 [Trema orientale]
MSQQAGPLLTRNRSHQSPHNKDHNSTHYINRLSQTRRLSPARRHQIGRHCLELLRRGPALGHAPPKRPELPRGPVLRRGGTGASPPERPGSLGRLAPYAVSVLDRHGRNQRAQRLLGPPDLTIPDRPLTQSRNRDLGELLAMPDRLDAVSHGIADVQRLHDPVEKLRDEPIERGLRDLRRVATHYQNRLELGLAAEKSVEKLPEPGDREEAAAVSGSGGGAGDGGLVGGGQESGESIGDVFLEEVEVFELLFMVSFHGDHLVAAYTDSVQKGTLAICCTHIFFSCFLSLSREILKRKMENELGEKNL